MQNCTEFTLAGRPLGPELPCLVIAEIAQTHDGSLGQAHAFIAAIARAGADAVKLQTHIAAAESTPAEPWRVRFSTQDKSRYDYWRRMEFSADQWRELKSHAEDLGLIFLSSPFSDAAVELLSELDIAAWKVASGEVANRPLLEQMAATGKPVILSSGMSPWSELDGAATTVRSAGAPLAILQCTSAYPCPAKQVGLNLIDEMRQRYGCPAGLSDHSGTIYPGLAAAALGCEILEVHVTLSREMFGPDVAASVTTSELRQLVDGIRFIEAARQHPLDKDHEAAALGDMRRLFTKSLVARGELAAGTVLETTHLAAKKPGSGVPAERLKEVLGRRLIRPLSDDQLLAAEDLEPALEPTSEPA